MNKVRIISDLHGNGKCHVNLTRGVEASICTGDVGFDYRYLSKIDGAKHKCFRGNHDHDGMCNYPHYMGEYGLFELNSVNGYFISGADSIDKAYRISRELSGGCKSWWEDEQLSYEKLKFALSDYIVYKPQFVLSHDCPKTISDLISNPNILKEFGLDPYTYTNRTQQCLQACFDAWQPKLWIFGHYHKNIDVTINNTRFICLKEFGYVDVNENLELV